MSQLLAQLPGLVAQVPGLPTPASVGSVAIPLVDNPKADFSDTPWWLSLIKALLIDSLEEHYGSLEGCLVVPDRAAVALRNIQAELDRVKDLL